MHRRFPILLSFPLMLVALAALDAGEAKPAGGAAKPLPKDADASHLRKAWIEKVRAWNHATMDQAYATVGARAPRWDDAAVALLKQWADWFTEPAQVDPAVVLEGGQRLLAL